MEIFDLSDWYQLSCKSLLRLTLFEDNEFKLQIDEDSEEQIEKVISELVQNSQDITRQLDSHIIYIASGGLYIVSQFFLSEKMSNAILFDFLLLAFLFLGISICATALSFIFAVEVVNRTHLATSKFKVFFQNTQKIGNEIKECNGLTDFQNFLFDRTDKIANRKVEITYIKMNKIWLQISKNGRIAERLKNLVSFSNLSSYSFFIAGLACFMFFGFVNLYFLKVA